jgi:hypothetical protein
VAGVIPVEKAGAYGMIVQHRILHCLPVADGDEFDRLDRRKRRTPAVQQRLDELWDLAIQLHQRQREAEDREIDANLQARDARLRAKGIDPETQPLADWWAYP